MDTLHKLLEIYYNFLIFDLEVFCNKWLYIPFLIPAALYLSFFMIKWTILTVPLWLPFKIIAAHFKR